MDKYIQGTDGASLAMDLRGKWVTTPILTGFWIAMEPLTAPVAHLASWVICEPHARQSKIVIYQAEVDKGTTVSQFVEPVFAEIAQWAAKVNTIIPENQPRVSKIEMQTFHGADKFERYLHSHGVGDIERRTVMQWDI
jgi:hypothetical protein